MKTRSGAVHRDQPRKKPATKSTSYGTGTSYPPNTFAGLPYDIKYHFLREFHYAPSELLSLSQINQSWRGCANAEALWNPWFEVRIDIASVARSWRVVFADVI